jgi:hypothetical protein
MSLGSDWWRCVYATCGDGCMEVVVAGRDPSTGLRVMLEGVLARTYGSVPSLLNSRAVEPGTSTIRLRVDMLMWQRCD